MKSLKLDHALAQQVQSGKKTSTWRVNDDKDLHVNDVIALIDKVDPLKPESWIVIGTAKISSVLEKQLGQVDKSDMEEQEQFTSVQETIKVLRGYYGNQVDVETPVKIIRFVFSKSEDVGTISPLKVVEAQLFADGGSRGNPGPSAAGFVLMDMQGTIIVENGLYLGVTTNNQAEYQAFKLGLEAALERKVTVLHVYLDSMLVVNQVKGVYKVSNRELVPINRSIKELLQRFSKVVITHVPRERNRKADAIVNEILDASK